MVDAQDAAASGDAGGRICPMEASASVRREYFADLLKLMEDGPEHDRIGEFLRERNANRRVLPRVRLPLAPIEQQKPITMATQFRLAVAPALFMEFETGDRAAKV